MTELCIGPLVELADPGCREFSIGEGDWPFQGFVVRRGDDVHAYENRCAHAGHPLNWSLDRFLTGDGRAIVCASHGALYEIETGRCIGGPCKGGSLRPVGCEVHAGNVYVTVPQERLPGTCV